MLPAGRIPPLSAANALASVVRCRVLVAPLERRLWFSSGPAAPAAAAAAGGGGGGGDGGGGGGGGGELLLKLLRLDGGWLLLDFENTFLALFSLPRTASTPLVRAPPPNSALLTERRNPSRLFKGVEDIGVGGSLAMDASAAEEAAAATAAATAPALNVATFD